MDKKTTQTTHRPLVFGEVLFDVFSGGREVLGGAPFNVAYHLAALGEDPLFISAVGTDERGDRIANAMQRMGMDLSGLQRDPDHPTGTVEVSLANGQPSYVIHKDVAWDFIQQVDESLVQPSEDEARMLIHGTLAQRCEHTRATLQRLREPAGIQPLVDLNLREPYDTSGVIRDSLAHTRWLKLNRFELEQVAGYAFRDDSHMLDYARYLIERHAFEAILITHGEYGAHALHEEGLTFLETPPKVDNLADTVGAGDAFTAVAAIGLLREWPLRWILDRAIRFAARICTIQGALPDDDDFYHETLSNWSD